MKALRYFLFPIPYSLILLLFLCACTKPEVSLSPEEEARADSLALRVGVMPVLNCLPVYYADSLGLFDDEGIRVKLLPYTAQMDIDTALIRRHAHVAYSDLIRALRLSGEHTPVRAFLSTDEPLSLVTVKGRRVNKIHQLRERMIAISRLCITDYWCEQFIDTGDVVRPDFYRPQVHDVRLRTEMLRTGLMDAAILPEPYTSWMLAAGNIQLAETPDKGAALAAWVFIDSLQTDTFRMKQIACFVRACRRASDMINEGERADIVRTILSRECRVTPEALDSIRLPKIAAPRKPTPQDVDVAVKWLKAKKRLPKQARPDSLIYELHSDQEP